jgi:cell division protein FtsI/penicillin-binding protein 2
VLIEGGARGGGALPPLTRRLRWVFVAMLVGFGGLVLRLWWLQVLRGDRYRERTVSNVVHERYLPSIRGRILDRNGVALADNRAAFNLYAPAKTVTPELRVQLKRMLGLTEDDLAKIDARIATATKRKVREPILCSRTSPTSAPRASTRSGSACRASRSATSPTVTIRTATWPPTWSAT